MAVQISQEVDRRLHLSVTSAERAAEIREVYQPLHPHVYHLKVFCAKTIFLVSSDASLTLYWSTGVVPRTQVQADCPLLSKEGRHQRWSLGLTGRGSR